MLDVPFGGIIRALEGPGEVVDCDRPPCPLRGGCHLRGALRNAQEMFLASLDRARLRELGVRPEQYTIGGTCGTRSPRCSATR